MESKEPIENNIKDLSSEDKEKLKEIKGLLKIRINQEERVEDGGETHDALLNLSRKILDLLDKY